MNYSILQIAEVINSSFPRANFNAIIQYVSVDSRNLLFPESTLFFALPGQLGDGHAFISNAYGSGVRNFVISKEVDGANYIGANFLRVSNSLNALQILASYHRSSHPELKRIGITGSNGKTIIKEWLYQMLFDRFSIVKSPKSYNSQIGMPLSLLGIEAHHDLGIFEAGISEMGEMTHHLDMLQPNIGIISNIGSAHDAGFANRDHKLEEKLILFESATTIIYSKDDLEIDRSIKNKFGVRKALFTWGKGKDSNLQIIDHHVSSSLRKLKLKYRQEKVELILKFTDEASFENAMHCISCLLLLKIPLSEIQTYLDRISGLDLRLEMSAGIDGSFIINDAYSADLDSLKIALDFMKLQSGNRKKIAILSSFDQSGMTGVKAFESILTQCEAAEISELHYISKEDVYSKDTDVKLHFYQEKNEFLEGITDMDFSNTAILIKGARRYEMEELAYALAEKGHSAFLSINLNAIERNLRVYNSYLKEGVGIIAIVKASAYGTGSARIAQLLENNRVAYLGVAFTDEGISLRKSGIKLPIIILNPDISAIPLMAKYGLEPEVYSIDQLRQIINYTVRSSQVLKIHLKLDTGMHRLGFVEEDLIDLASLLKGNELIRIGSIFTHLASSEDSKDDAYSLTQFALFDEMFNHISAVLSYEPKRHVLNSGGISRFPNRQYDFVRLGIGMYGIDGNPEIAIKLQKSHGLHAQVIQIKQLKKGDSIGYNRTTILEKDCKVGIINIGYADGLMRNLGNENYSVFINNQEAPILGRVCMDLTIVDLSNVTDVQVGTIVTIFDEVHSIENLAKKAGTIPYEILSRISERVLRVFILD